MADSKVQTNKAGGTDSLPIRKLAEPFGSHRYQSDLNGGAGTYRWPSIITGCSQVLAERIPRSGAPTVPL